MSGGGASLNRGNSRPNGGWSNRVSSPSARPSIQRPSGSNNISRDLNRSGNRDFNRSGNFDGNRSINRDVNRDVNRNINRDVNRNINRDVNRNINRNVNWNTNRRVNIGNVNVNPGWARPGWGVARPWNAGWYGGWSSPSWGWWGARAATWGVASLATAAVINNAVDNAVSSNATYIVVPNTDYQLLYGSVQPSGSQGVSFAVTADGSTYQLSADCNQGLLDGREPSNAAEAELLNAACQVAFGSV
ncbi:hypothetical protein KBY93_07095 [Synechococcus sp. J7-Johnson]|uniref:hypothetical protein n=1 Tax=Synechococcus sp. J7-Johnson TaxID=2823737 RepID=UPI0020CE2C68|nr:hypothetical protein [Synechococcus sp. J7-Johnson]MCP9840402.1 hypothetical protein [Synechococcus sp. J7-Johnson]